MIELIKLPYDFNALEPYIDSMTVEFHYSKHHKGYVDKLNGIIKGTEFENMSLKEIVIESQGIIFNNAAQVLNHDLYRNQFYSNHTAGLNGFASIESSELGLKIIDKRGNFEAFKETFNNVSMSHFGSGWTWLVKDQKGEIDIINTPNAENPIINLMIPLIAIDIREHSYYLKYQNRRLEYLQNIWNLIDRNKVNEIYKN